jgi:hypothetical protein
VYWLRKILFSFLIIFLFSFGCLADINEKNVTTNSTNSTNITFNTSEINESAEQNLSIANSTDLNEEMDNKTKINYDELRKQVIPESGIRINATWGDFAPALVEKGVLNLSKLEDVLSRSWQPLTDEQRSILINGSDEQIVISRNNTLCITNVFWGLGLANRNQILDNGMITENPSMTPKYASTALWIFGNDEGPSYLSKFEIINLSKGKVEMIEEIGNNSYRPCCGNPVSFPDCNHGMASLGLAQLMASQGASKEEVNHALLAVNSYWFPQTYLEISAYFKSQGIEWKDVDPELLLSKNYSSYSGYQKMRSELEKLPDSYLVGSSCGI